MRRVGLWAARFVVEGTSGDSIAGVPVVDTTRLQGAAAVAAMLS